MKKILAVASATLMLGVGGVATASVATAATAPSCVHLRQYDSNYGPFGMFARSNAKVTNTCSTTKRVRVIWRWASDGQCNSVKPGSSFTSTREGKNPYVTELRAC